MPSQGRHGGQWLSRRWPCSLVHISRTDADTEGDSFLLCLSRDVLDDSFDSTALFEKCADSSARAFGCDEDVFGVCLIDDREAVGEVDPS